MRQYSDLKRLIVAGSISGLLVLGVGGRLLMRGLAYLTPESPRFTAVGTLEVLGLGVLWGGLTAPVLRLLRRTSVGGSRSLGLLHGVIVFATALIGFLMITGGVGRLVAPTAFIVLGVILFPLLFLTHGVVVVAMSSRRNARRR